jgi:hypothetical protein
MLIGHTALAAQRRGHDRLAVRDLPQGSAVLASDACRLAALLGDARVVDQQHAAAIWRLRAKLLPHRIRGPRRVRDEVLQTLVLPRVAEPLQHPLHVLPLRVAQQTTHVPQRVARLTAAHERASEAVDEPRQPLQQVDITAQQPLRRSATSVRVQACVP